MRELKFRAWDKVQCKYIEVVRMQFSLARTPILITQELSDKQLLTDPASMYVIEQYTGLKDKNGEEIYEGDIVEQFVCGVKKFKGQKCGRRTIWQVRWNEEECCFELHYLSGSLFGDSLMAMGEEYETIGNIHENQDLLEEEE